MIYFVPPCLLSLLSANVVSIMKQKYILIALFALLIGTLFSTKVVVNKEIDIMVSGQGLNTISNKTVTVIMHNPESLQAIYVSADSAPMEKNLLKAYDHQNYGGNSMPMSPIPTASPVASSDDSKSGLFSFDTPKENNNQNWGWIAQEVNNSDNYQDISPERRSSGGLFQDSDSRLSSGYERESFFDNTLYGSDKGNNFLDGYDFGGDQSKESSDSSPYSTMSW